MPYVQSSITGTIRGLIVPIYAPSVLAAIARGGALIALPLFALETGGGPALAAGVVGLRAAGTMAANLPSGYFASKFGDKVVMLAGLAILVAALGVLSGFASEVTLLISSFVLGIGSGSWIMARLLHITETVRLEQRGRVISILAGIERGGTLVGPVLAGVAIQTLGYRVVFVSVGVLFLVALLVVLWKTSRAHVRRETRRTLRVIQVVFRFRDTLLKGGSVMLFLSYLRNARMFLLPVWGATIGLSPGEIGLVVSLSSAIDMAMFLPAGMILDHIGRKTNLIACLLLLSFATALLPLTSGFVTFLLVAMLAGLGNGFGTGIFMTLGGDFAPRFGRSEFLGVWRFMGDFGGVVSPFAIGSLAQATSMLVACMSSGALGCLGAILALVFIPETLKAYRIRREMQESGIPRETDSESESRSESSG